jgi:hypothetical protein
MAIATPHKEPTLAPMVTRRLNRLLALTEVVAGGIGSLVVAASLPGQRRDGLSLVSLLTELSLPVACLVAGLALWRQLAAGRVLSLIVQAAQVLAFNSGALIVQVLLGPYLRVALYGTARISFEYGATIAVVVSPTATLKEKAIAVNLVPCLFIWALLRPSVVDGERRVDPSLGP